MNNTIAVVVTYNRKTLLEKCINAIANQTIDKFDIVVIDNASTDGTDELVKVMQKKYDKLHYENTGANIGGAGGFSYGIKWAVQKGYDYLWIMDDDTIPKNDCLEKLFEADNALNGKYAFLSSYAMWIDESPCEMNVPTVSLRWRKDISNQFNNSLIALDSASFVSMFFKRSTVEKYGLPIKEFFIWGDDVEYSKRIAKEEPGYFVYDSKVIHEMASNIATTICDETDTARLGRYKFLYRNKYYLAKHGAKREKLFFWIYIKNEIKSVLKSSTNHKIGKIGVILKSAIKGKFFNPNIEYVKYCKK